MPAKRGTSKTRGAQQPQLKGSLDPGYGNILEQKAGDVQAPPAALLEDPKIVAALEQDSSISLDPDEDTEKITLRGSVEQEEDIYEEPPETEIGNGSTLPFRYRGRPSLAYTTCSEPVKDRNRGCPVWYRCPLRDLGSGNLIYQHKRTKQIRHSNCYDFVMTGMARDPKLVLLPGVTETLSLEKEWAPFPDGRMPEPGPNKPKTHIVDKWVKNEIVSVFDEDLVRQYQLLRRRGEVA